MAHDLWAELDQEWQELVANPCPEVVGIAVGGVVGEDDAVASEVRVDGRAPCHGEWPDEADGRICRGRGARGKNRQPRGTRTAKQAEQHRFGSVIGVVGRGENARAAGVGRRHERRVACVTCAGLQIAAPGDVDRGPLERNVELTGEVGGKVELCSCTLPQAMVDAVGDETMPEFLAQAPKGVEERHRIASPADRHEDGLAASNERVGLDGTGGEREQGGRMRGHH